MSRMNESQLLNEIIRAAYPFLKLERVNVGRVRTEDGRWFSTGVPKGHPDLHGDIPAQFTVHGHAVPVYIEAKVHPNKPSPEQIGFIDEHRAGGCCAGVCYTVSDAWRLIRPYIRPELDRISDEVLERWEKMSW